MFCSLMSVFMYFSGFESFAPLERWCDLRNSGVAKNGVCLLLLSLINYLVFIYILKLSIDLTPLNCIQ